MEAADKAEELVVRHQNRRAAHRYGVDEDAHLLLVKLGSTVPCRIVDLSLNGCLLRTQDRFLAGMLVRVEVAFKVRGFAFRFSGVTQWTDRRNLVGIRFADVPMRRREELAEALSEVEAENAMKAAALAAAKLAAEEQTRAKEVAAPAVLESASPEPARLSPVQIRTEVIEARVHPLKLVSPIRDGAQPVEAQKSADPLAEPPQAKTGKRERREQSRHEVDTSAVIYLVNVASRLSGRILDLSVGGCRISTDERFPVGIYTRVEAEFRLDGLPFLLGGVTQAIHDRRQVGIRFLDMSTRKREQLEQLIEEIEELRREEDESSK
jgi:c-di-GMP-binding flagellar brake protein YcgR